MAPDRQASPPATALAAQLREAMLTGELTAGQRLIEGELAERFDAPRGAVRQALVQLQGEGLVERTHNRGARVRTVSLAEAIEITEARAVLEGLCAAKAARLATPAEREGLRALGEAMTEAVRAGDVLGYSRQVEAVHQRIRELARQRTIADLLDRLRYQSVRHNFRVALLPGRPAAGLVEHLEVIDAVVAGAPDKAEAAMRDHLRSVIDALRQLSDSPGLALSPLGRGRM